MNRRNAPTAGMLPHIELWIDDLRHLHARYLREHFRPREQGIRIGVLALALSGADPDTRRHVLAHVPPELAEDLRRHEATEATTADVFRAQLQVVTVYFWEMAYHGHPEIYEMFSALQDLPLAEIFPLDAARGRDVADIGTGGGRVLIHLAGSASRLWGVDPCPALLELAGRKLAGRDEVTLLDGTFRQIPLPDSSVDLVVSSFAFQTSEERGGDRGLAEVRRVLRPGGRALIAVGNPRTVGFLRARDLVEQKVTRSIRWALPDPRSPRLLHSLLQLAHVDFGGEDTTTTAVSVFEVPG